MKRITCLWIAVLFLFVMAGCGVANVANPDTEEADSENVFCIKEFTLQLSDQWIGNCVIDVHEVEGNISFVAFSAAECYKETEEGWLFSIARYDNMDYTEQPSYEILGEQNGATYIVVYPTDVQTEGASDTAKAQYYELVEEMGDVIKSFQLTEN